MNICIFKTEGVGGIHEYFAYYNQVGGMASSGAKEGGHLLKH